MFYSLNVRSQCRIQSYISCTAYGSHIAYAIVYGNYRSVLWAYSVCNSFYTNVASIQCCIHKYILYTNPYMISSLRARVASVIGMPWLFPFTCSAFLNNSHRVLPCLLAQQQLGQTLITDFMLRVSCRLQGATCCLTLLIKRVWRPVFALEHGAAFAKAWPFCAKLLVILGHSG